MSKLYETVSGVLARGSRSTEEVVTECARAGLQCRPETVSLFLQLSREIAQRDGLWCRTGGSKQERILIGLRKAFGTGQAYLPIDRLSQFFDEEEAISADDIAIACEESGEYRLQGKTILRST